MKPKRGAPNRFWKCPVPLHASQAKTKQYNAIKYLYLRKKTCHVLVIRSKSVQNIIKGWGKQKAISSNQLFEHLIQLFVEVFKLAVLHGWQRDCTSSSLMRKIAEKENRDELLKKKKRRIVKKKTEMVCYSIKKKERE